MVEMSFMASREHFDGISSRSEVIPGGNIFRVQLRLCLWDTQGPQPDRLPQQLIIIVNGKLCLPPTEANHEHDNRPVDITHLVHPSDEAPNSIMLLWSLSDTRDFAMSVCLVKPLTAEMLMKQLKYRAFFPSYRTLTMIREEMPAVHEPVFSLRRFRVSLLCPLEEELVSMPCRAVSCSHVQIFDAVPFLQKNEEEETWKCPVCDQEILFENLVIDEYFLIVLHNIVCEDIDCEEIDILYDGTWVPSDFFLDALEIAEKPGIFGRHCHQINLTEENRYETVGEVSGSSTEVEASEKLPGPHPGAAVLPSTSTAGESPAEQELAQGSEDQAQALDVPPCPEKEEANLIKLPKRLKSLLCHQGKNKRQRRMSRILSELRDLFSSVDAPGPSTVPDDPPPDSSWVTAATAWLESSLSITELQMMDTLVSTLPTMPTTGVRIPQQPAGESSSLDTRDLPSSQPPQ
ncbi:E3 SUMO-protein ligase PIAS3-like isoform X2 [Tachyglossus aculeatus]|nr:E3 SUMO-protein ligase PIAS3-like isoform X2 [Tachyglossus aculeatus]